MKVKTYQEIDFATAIYKQKHESAEVEYNSGNGWHISPPFSEYVHKVDFIERGFKFRIVTEREQTYRPWKTVDEVPLGKIARDKRNKTRKLIGSASMGGGEFSSMLQVNGAAAETFCDMHTMDEGTPCGVLE